MAGSDTRNVLDPTVLKCLAIIAGAHNRTVEEELNVAAKSYVRREFAEHGIDRFTELTFSDQTTAATK